MAVMDKYNQEIETERSDQFEATRTRQKCRSVRARQGAPALTLVSRIDLIIRFVTALPLRSLLSQGRIRKTPNTTVQDAY